eukprot:6121731-Pleurochrysis_carterae.AAC.2
MEARSGRKITVEKQNISAGPVVWRKITGQRIDVTSCCSTTELPYHMSRLKRLHASTQAEPSSKTPCEDVEGRSDLSEAWITVTDVPSDCPTRAGFSIDLLSLTSCSQTSGSCVVRGRVTAIS